MICEVKGCEATANRLKKTLCEKHYYRQYRHGDVNKTERIVGDDTRRFWSYVRRGADNDCWEWQGQTTDRGYGVINIKGKLRGAHIFSKELSTGNTKPASLDTCHTCDNRKCVNPGHLYWGTRQQNVDDAWSRNRMPYGEDKYQAKLSESQVVQLRKDYAAGDSVPELVDKYQVADSTIRGIVLGLKWKRAGGPITRRRQLGKKVA